MILQNQQKFVQMQLCVYLFALTVSEATYTRKHNLE